MKTKVSSQQTPFILVNHAAFLQAPVTLFNPMVRVDITAPLSPTLAAVSPTTRARCCSLVAEVHNT